MSRTCQQHLHKTFETLVIVFLLIYSLSVATVGSTIFDGKNHFSNPMIEILLLLLVLLIIFTINLVVGILDGPTYNKNSYPIFFLAILTLFNSTALTHSEIMFSQIRYLLSIKYSGFFCLKPNDVRFVVLNCIVCQQLLVLEHFMVFVFFKKHFFFIGLSRICLCLLYPQIITCWSSKRLSLCFSYQFTVRNRGYFTFTMHRGAFS